VPGDLVWGIWGHRSEGIVPAERMVGHRLPAGLEPLAGAFARVGAIAYNAVLAADIHLGEDVAVFGQGVIGLLTTRLARLSGATVTAVDALETRLAAARGFGAAHTLDARRGKVAEALRGLTGGRGADLAIEISGAYPALHEALRSVAPGGRVVASGFYQGEGVGLRLGDEFHHNRIELISSQISGVAPDASHRWSKLRLWQTAVRLQHEGRLNLLPLITDTVPFAAAPALFDRLDRGDPAILQSVLDFTA